MTAPATATDERITDLEIRLSHQEAALDQLTRQLLEREKEIRLLTVRFATLEQQLRSMADPGIAPLQQEPPPPHY